MPAANPASVQTHIDEEGRRFEYVHIRRPGSTGLAVHFSAFFGKWGEAKPYRDKFQGYFHRLRMLGTSTAHDWLFLCDAYGAFDNGTYYTGHRGDLFVERAMHTILDTVVAEDGYVPEQMVTVGSSMGATAALKFGLEWDSRGVVAIGPHVELDTSARLQNRAAEVAFICPDGDWEAAHNHPYTRQIAALLAARPADRPLPRLFIQSCIDDVGVHSEQVLPLVERWRALGGEAALDARPVGGHTSDHATAPLLLDAIGRLLGGEGIDVDAYQGDPAFAGQLVRPPFVHRLRTRLHPWRVRARALRARVAQGPTTSKRS